MSTADRLPVETSSTSDPQRDSCGRSIASFFSSFRRQGGDPDLSGDLSTSRVVGGAGCAAGLPWDITMVSLEGELTSIFSMVTTTTSQWGCTSTSDRLALIKLGRCASLDAACWTPLWLSATHFDKPTRRVLPQVDYTFSAHPSVSSLLLACQHQT